jgi:hypothetical protein
MLDLRNNTKLPAFTVEQSDRLAIPASSAVHHILCMIGSYKEEAENVATMDVRFRPQRPSATCPDQS